MKISPEALGLSRAALAALAIESLLLALLLALLNRGYTKAPEPLHVIQLQVSTMQPPKAKPPQPAPPKPHVQAHQLPPKPQPVQPAQPSPAKALPPLPVASTPTPTSVPAPVAHPSPAPSKPSPPVAKTVTSAPDPRLRASFEDKLRTAIQAALNYPYAARMAHMHGRTQVSFVIRHGQIGEAQVVTSSGYRILDTAALQALMTAHVPELPEELEHQDLAFTLWVDHRLQTED